MEIKAEVKAKIRNYIVAKNIEQTNKELPEKGTYFIEYGYELAENDKFANLLFVVATKLIYHNYSISDKEYSIYVFDRNDGTQITDFEKKGECYVGFFQDLKIVEAII